MPGQSEPKHKSAPLSDVVDTLRAVAGAVTSSAGEALSARQIEVLQLLADGYSTTAIADRLFLSTHTVEKRVSTIFGKLRLTESPDDNRRILAVLDFLAAS